MISSPTRLPSTSSYRLGTTFLKISLKKTSKIPAAKYSNSLPDLAWHGNMEPKLVQVVPIIWLMPLGSLIVYNHKFKPDRSEEVYGSQWKLLKASLRELLGESVARPIVSLDPVSRE